MLVLNVDSMQEVQGAPLRLTTLRLKRLNRVYDCYCSSLDTLETLLDRTLVFSGAANVDRECEVAIGAGSCAGADSGQFSYCVIERAAQMVGDLAAQDSEHR